MTRDVTTAFARTVVDELVRGGVRHAVVAPGSRSAPLALALAADGRMQLTVILDERTAGFVGIGIGRATGRPAVVVTTSGTAAANLHPAVLEAHHGEVPLIVATADRPPELRGVGAPQTIDQVGLFGGAVRWAIDVEPPADRPDAAEAWRGPVARAVIEATGARPGPVHVNLPFREPLVPTGAALVPAPGRSDDAPWRSPAPGLTVPDPAVVRTLVERVRNHPRGVLVLGAGAVVDPAVVTAFTAAAGWPLVADPAVVPAGAHGADPPIGTIEALVRYAPTAAAVPQTWIRVGAIPAVRVVAEWLDTARGVVIDPTGVRRDPAGTAEPTVIGDPSAVLSAVATVLAAGTAPDPAWSDAWRSRDRAARTAMDAWLDSAPAGTEPRVARDVVASLPAGATLLVGSSMPIRDVATFAAPRADVTVQANRGVNGIDGFAGTALGLAVAGPTPVVALAGDLTFLHDLGGLLATSGRSVDLVFVVVDNRGGGIFSFLPQAAFPEHFETLFGTPPPVDPAAVAAGFGLAVTEVTDPDAIGAEMGDVLAAGGVRVVIVRTDRARNVEDHRALWAAAAVALSAR